jgi:hypothetical protein
VAVLTEPRPGRLGDAVEAEGLEALPLLLEPEGLDRLALPARTASPPTARNRITTTVMILKERGAVLFSVIGHLRLD